MTYTNEELSKLLDECSIGYAKLYLRFKALESENALLKRQLEATEPDLDDSDRARHAALYPEDVEE